MVSYLFAKICDAKVVKFCPALCGIALNNCPALCGIALDNAPALCDIALDKHIFVNFSANSKQKSKIF
jgi:hypothetical protein